MPPAADVAVSVVVLPDRPWADARPRWEAADALGASTLWTYDHLSWRWLPGPWYGAVGVLAAAAVATSRARLGTLVTSPVFRHPVPLASDVLTLDDVSDGRLTLGIGAGGTGADATALGVPPRSRGERAGRLEEMVELLDLLLRQERTSWSGQHFTADDVVYAAPRRQSPRVPFVVAASGPRGMRLAARYGEGWVTYGDRTTLSEPMAAAEAEQVVRLQCAQLDEACAAVGRDPGSLRRVLLTGLTAERPLRSVAEWDDLVGRYAALGFAEVVVHWPDEDPAHPFAGSREVLEEVLARG